MTETAVLVTASPERIEGFEVVGPDRLAEVLTLDRLVVVDASIARGEVLGIPAAEPLGEVVLWWRSDAHPTLSTDDVLRLGYPLVFDLEDVAAPAVATGPVVPIERRGDDEPSAEYVTLLGTPSARATLAEVSRAVAAMRRPTVRPLWDPHGQADEQLRRPVDPAQVDGSWRAGPDGTLTNSTRPALATLLRRSNKATMDLYVAHLEALPSGGYRIPPAALILGATGTGKTVMARRLHEALHPDDHQVRELVEVSAPAIRGSAFSSEFFGHMEEAWTGAGYAVGPALEATFGTLFIDEIGDLDARAQQSLLTFLVRRRARLQGAEGELFLPLQIVGATNRPLERMVEAGTFRQDLFNRFPLVIRLQPLRDRLVGSGDADRLITEVLSDPDVNPIRDQGARRGELTVSGVDRGALDVLVAHDYRTGNFRELIDVLRRGVRAAAEQRSATLLASHLVFPPAVTEAAAGEPVALVRNLDETVALLGAVALEVAAEDLARLAERLGAPIFASADGRQLVVHAGVAWVASEGDPRMAAPGPSR